VPALAPGKARRLTLLRSASGVRFAVASGLFFVLTACARPSPERAAAAADKNYGTGAFAWIAAHDPSALVAWDVPAPLLAAVAPDARVSAARGSEPCAQAAAAHAALVVLVPRGPGAGARRDAALDCGVALYRDARVLVIAPR
jgi:hypothetical protein